MDTSKEYIEMCERAKEIQEYYRTCTDFDKVIPSFIYDESIQRVSQVIYCPSALRKQINTKQNLIVLSIEHGRDIGIWIPEEDSCKISQDTIWLPRQDQLQEMIDFQYLYHIWGGGTDGHSCTCSTGDRDSHMVGKKFNNLEQLWLAFVMKERYNKQWNGTDWIPC